jgi:hypothetical protein
MKKWIMGIFMICTLHQIWLGSLSELAWDGQCSWHTWDRWAMHTGVSCTKLEGDYLKELGIDGTIILLGCGLYLSCWGCMSMVCCSEHSNEL